MTAATGPVASTDPQPTLRVRDLELTLDLGYTRTPVVQDLTFDVMPGEILGIVGESGSGKSLTGLSVMKMLPAAASVTDGSICYEGTDLLQLAEPDMRTLRGNELGMVFQDPLAFLNPVMTVGQQVREVLTLHGMSRQDADKRTVELLQLVGVRDPHRRVHDYPHQFSGGMRQRVIIAIAVANNPRLLIADEPTTALDVTVQAGILRLLRSLCDELGSALVLITHDMGVVEEVCDSMMVLYAGRVAERGPVQRVMSDPRHPYTRELMRSTPRLDAPRHHRLPAIPGQPPDATSRLPGCPFAPRCPLAEDRCTEQMPPLTVRQHSSAPDDEPSTHWAACWFSAEPLLRTTADTDTSSTADTPIATGDTLLDVTDLKISYSSGRRGLRFWRRDDPRPAVDGVSLQVRAGEAVGLVGESGCGKSTTARAILGLLRPDSGSVRIGGDEWTHLDADGTARLRRTVQMVFQDSYLSLNPRQSLTELLSEPLRVHRIVPKSDVGDRVRELVDMVGLGPSLLDRYPYQLSGGQRQRVGIARALALEPQLLVADEPVSALDVSVQAQIINLLADLRKELGLAYLVITHDLSVVRHVCERVAVMDDGRIVEQGSVAEVFAHPEHEFTKTLLAASVGAPTAAHAEEVGA